MLNFRQAIIDELPTLNEISMLSKAHWGYPKAWLEAWKDGLLISQEQFLQQYILVVEVDQQIIGFSAMKEQIANYEILHLWLLPAYIGKGIGKKLLQTIIQTFAKHDKPIIVEADPNAEAFYKSQGFVTFTQVESFPKGRFLPVMKKASVKPV